MREGISSSLQEWLLDRRIDVGVMHNPPPVEGFEIRPVLAEQMVLIAPRKRGIDPPFPATTRSVRLRDIVDLPLIMPGAPHSNRRLLDQAAVQHGVSLRVTLEADSVVLTKAMVKRGLGYTVLTMAAVQDDVARGELYAYPIMRPPLTNSLSIVVLRDTRSSRFVGPLTRHLEKIMRDLVVEGTWQGAVIRR